MPDPALSLTHIAENCGFNSLAFFSRTFKQMTGMPPSQFRAHTLNAQPVNGSRSAVQIGSMVASNSSSVAVTRPTQVSADP